MTAQHYPQAANGYRATKVTGRRSIVVHLHSGDSTVLERQCATHEQANKVIGWWLRLA